MLQDPEQALATLASGSSARALVARGQSASEASQESPQSGESSEGQDSAKLDAKSDDNASSTSFSSIAAKPTQFPERRAVSVGRGTLCSNPATAVLEATAPAPAPAPEACSSVQTPSVKDTGPSGVPLLVTIGLCWGK